MELVTCGEAVAPLLEAYGVKHIFGIPGNHTLELYRGLQHTSIRHITTRHEQGAAFMADGYARASGKVGVCFLISGPGLLNAATAIAQALADSVPMLVITGVAATHQIGQRLGTLHDLPDQRVTAASFCKASYTVDHADRLEPLISEAMWRLATERPGPIHIQIPLDVLQQPCPVKTSTQIPTAAPAFRLEPFLLPLNDAREPLLLIGGGCSGVSAIPELAEVLDCPVINTTNAKGLIPRYHPLHVGGSPSLPCLQRALAQADVVLAIGTEFGETDFDLLMGPPWRMNGQLLRIDIDEGQLDRNAVADLSAVAPARYAVDWLVNSLSSAQRHGAERTARLREEVVREPHYNREMAEFFNALSNALPNATLVGDSTRPTYYATWMLESDRPRAYFHSVSGFGTLGYAIPAAAGARLALPEHLPVIALIGDGGAQFTINELATLAQERINIPIIIWQNEGYEEIAHSLSSRSVATDTTLVNSPDWTLLAHAYGATYHAPTTHSELIDVLQQEFSAPTVIEVDQATFAPSATGQWYD